MSSSRPIELRRALVHTALAAAVVVAMNLEAGTAKSQNIVVDEVIVKFFDATPQPAIDAIFATLSLDPIQVLPLSGAHHARILSGASVSLVVSLLELESAVEYAHPNDIFEGSNHLTEPDDPTYPSQWSLSNRGRNAGHALGTIDADVDAPQAWEHRTNCSSRVVAFLDSGADLTHPDLAGNLWTNPGETPANGVDDDSNGVIDDVNGSDWVNLDGNPTDDHGHGTTTAGVMGAIGNNGVNISGACWQSQLMIVKVLDATNSGNWASLENGLAYAVANGATILNLSLGAHSPFRQATVDALTAATATGAVLIVAAAGNFGVNNDAPPGGAPANGNSFKPCSYGTADLICVAASNNRDSASGAGQANTNWGPASVDLFAPGEDIVTLRRSGLGGGITPLPGVDGTSYAAPHVTAAAAHCWELYPTETAAQIKARLLAGVDSRPNLRQPRAAGGPTRVLSGINNDGRLRMCMGDDFGDAPDPFTAPGLYPTLLASNGARHEDIGEEWLGDGPAFRAERDNGDAPARDHSLEVTPEFDADQVVPLDVDGIPNLTDNDFHDDGIEIFGPLLGVGLVRFQVCTDNHQVVDTEGGRYTGAAGAAQGDPETILVNDKAIYVNGFFDWNQDGDFDDTLEYAFSRRFVPPAPVAGTDGAATCHGFLSQIFLAPALLPPDLLWARFRLDYGEDVQHGLAGNAPVFEVGHTAPPAARYDTVTTLNRSRGQAQFGEVEDYNAGVAPHDLLLEYDLSRQGLPGSSLTLDTPVARAAILTDPKFTHTPASGTAATLRIEGVLGNGTLGPILGGVPLTQKTLPLQGIMRLCLLAPGCGLPVEVPLTVHGTAGVGIGGLVTASSSGIRISIQGAPWTIGTATVTNVMTSMSGYASPYYQGFGHTPMSGTLSASSIGTLQLVTPIKVTTNLPNPDIGGFGVLNVRFVPEPGGLMLLLTGAAALALLGRKRMKP
ncbi:MAG: S8 family serine peptidase [Myxococcota bacterium]